jgi:hypothetical protein
MKTIKKITDKERLDFLEELFSTTDNNNPAWKDFMSDVACYGFRVAINKILKRE